MDRPNISDSVALGVIAEQLEWWLEHNARQHRREGREPYGAMHVIPPVWPTREQLTRWIAHLKSAAQGMSAGTAETLQAEDRKHD